MPELKDTLKTIKLNESTVSVVLGAIVVLVVGIMALRWFNGSKSTPGVVTEQAAQETSQTGSQMATVPQGGTSHVVARGENLWTISQKYYSGSGYNWVDIASANKLSNPGVIHSGEKLVIPSVPVRQPSKLAAKTVSPITITGNSYTTVKGDSLWKIAVAAYGDGFGWTKIYGANKAIIGLNPGKIFSGVKLSIPR